jgi:hypothetical protein
VSRPPYVFRNRAQAARHQPAALGPKLWDPENPPEEYDEPERRAYYSAMKCFPSCGRCRAGEGTIKPGVGHCREHDAHCAEQCW